MQKLRSNLPSPYDTDPQIRLRIDTCLHEINMSALSTEEEDEELIDRSKYEIYRLDPVVYKRFFG